MDFDAADGHAGYLLSPQGAYYGEATMENLARAYLALRTPSAAGAGEAVGWCPRDATGHLHVEHAGMKHIIEEDDIPQLNKLYEGSVFAPFTVAPLYAHPTAHPVVTDEVARLREDKARLELFIATNCDPMAHSNADCAFIQSLHRQRFPENYPAPSSPHGGAMNSHDAEWDAVLAKADPKKVAEHAAYVEAEIAARRSRPMDCDDPGAGEFERGVSVIRAFVAEERRAKTRFNDLNADAAELVLARALTAAVREEERLVVTGAMVEHCVDWMRRTHGDLAGVTYYDMRDMLTAALTATRGSDAN